MKQLNLIPKAPRECGGSLNNTRHQKRTLNSKKPLNLTLKSQKYINLFKNKTSIEKIIFKQAKAFNVKIYSHSVQKDHIHLCLRFLTRQQYIAFIRAVTGLIARQIKKGIWKLRPYTRIVEWGRDFMNVHNYIQENEMEVQGLWEYRPRTLSFSKFRKNIEIF